MLIVYKVRYYISKDVTMINPTDRIISSSHIKAKGILAGGKTTQQDRAMQDSVEIKSSKDPGSSENPDKLKNAAKGIRDSDEAGGFSLYSIARSGFQSAVGAVGAILSLPGAAVGGLLKILRGPGEQVKRVPPGSDLILNPDIQTSTLLAPEVQKEVDNLTHSKVVGGNKAILMNNGVASFPERYRMIENAKHSINLQTLIFHSDETGRKTANLLAKKAKQGVKCRLLFDWILSRHMDPKMLKMMKDAGVEVLPYNTPADNNLPADSMDNIKKYVAKGFLHFIKGQSIKDIKLLPKWLMGKGEEEFEAWEKRNPELVDGIKNYINLVRNRWHMKILSVDGKEAIVGGLNIGSEYAYAGSDKVDQSQPPGSNSRRSCRDTDVKVEGPLAEEVNKTFAENWKYAGGKNEDQITTENPPANVAGGVPTRFLSHMPVEKQDRDIESWYYQMLANSQKTAYITNAYFIPTKEFKEALIKAAKRGVDVRVFTNSKKTNNRPLAYDAGRKHYRELLEGGVRIYEMTDKNFTTLHTKTAVFDGEVATVGSHNLDPRSLSMHTENNIVIQDRDFSLRMHQTFKKDLEMSNEIIPADVKKDSRLYRIKQWFGNKILQLI